MVSSTVCTPIDVHTKMASGVGTGSRIPTLPPTRCQSYEIAPGAGLSMIPGDRRNSDPGGRVAPVA
jgi:hypothetical protein